MKRHLTTYLILALLGITTCHANEEEMPAASPKPKNLHIHLGVDGFWLHYKVYYRYSTQRCNSFFIGPRLEFEYRKPRTSYFDIQGLYAVGNYCTKTKYTYYKTAHFKRQGNWVDVNLGYGYTFQPSYSPHFLLSVFFGPGAYYSKAGDWMNRWGYWQFGFKGTQDCSKMLNIGVDFRATYGLLHKHIWGIKLGLPFIFYLDQRQRWDIRFKPYLLKLNIDNCNTFIGATLEAGYSF